MLSGILSDTIILKSPTATEIDRITVEELSKIARLDYKEYGMEMLKAGADFDDLDIDEVVHYDYKDFEINGINFGIGQVLTANCEQLLNKKDEFIDFLNRESQIKGYKLLALFITDLLNNGAYVLYSTNGEQILSNAFNKPDMHEGYYLEGIISRKKQIVPNIMSEFENMN